MREVDLKQGTPEWENWRDTGYTDDGGKGSPFFSASDAPKLFTTERFKLLKKIALGEKEEFSEFKLGLFKKGHDTEAKARPIVAEFLSQEVRHQVDLSPLCCVIDSTDFPLDTPIDVLDKIGTRLACSLDGYAEAGVEKVIWEHKLFNEEYAKDIKEHKAVAAKHYWQLEHQLFVTRFDKAILCFSDGTAENMEMIYYTSKPARRSKLIEEWYKFAEELESFEIPTVDASDNEEWLRLEAEYSELVAWEMEAKNAKDAKREELLRIADGRPTAGMQWQATINKGRSTVCEKLAAAQGVDLTPFKKQAKDSISLRRVKK